MTRTYVKEARRRVGPKRARIRPVIERLAVEHADAAIALAFRSPLELLVSVMLSAQTTDVNVNRVTATLFEKYRIPEDYLAVPQEELERDIFATGFYRQKAKSLRGTMRLLRRGKSDRSFGFESPHPRERRFPEPTSFLPCRSAPQPCLLRAVPLGRKTKPLRRRQRSN